MAANQHESGSFASTAENYVALMENAMVICSKTNIYFLKSNFVN
jgi:hypothetical protein